MNCKSLEFFELSNEILTRGNSLRFRALGGSMNPFIRNGDILEIEPVDEWKIGQGDVIFYRTLGKRLVVHRVIKKFSQNDKQVFVIKGDSIPDCGEDVLLEDILGKVVAIERNGRRMKFDRGLNRLMNIFYAKISPFSRWIYPPLRKIKHKINKIKDKYADRRSVST